MPLQKLPYLSDAHPEGVARKGGEDRSHHLEIHGLVHGDPDVRVVLRVLQYGGPETIGMVAHEKSHVLPLRNEPGLLPGGRERLHGDDLAIETFGETVPSAQVVAAEAFVFQRRPVADLGVDERAVRGQTHDVPGAGRTRGLVVPVQHVLLRSPEDRETEALAQCGHRIVCRRIRGRQDQTGDASRAAQASDLQLEHRPPQYLGQYLAREPA